MPFIQKAANIIRNSGIISYPTESVFGLGCDPLSEIAVQRILELKQRPVTKGLIIVAGSLDQLMPYIEITDKEKQIILSEKAPMTWLVKKSDFTPDWVSGSHEKLAVRTSWHPLVKALCEELNQPIISTSANPTGEKPALSSQQSKNYFSNNVDFYLDGQNKISGAPTTIKDIETGKIIR